MKNKYVFIVIGLLSVLLITTVCFSIAQIKKTGSPTPNYYSNSITSPFIPKTMTFAGENVPLSTYWVHEALDRELIINCYQHSRTLRVYKLSARFFPTIEKILKEEGVPEDFKYLCVAESGLENVTSPAAAGGYWQFIPSTAKNYGLAINNDVDERCHIEKSTRAACAYLKKLKNQFGNWTSAAAAYNRGEAGLQNAISDQSCANYWDLYLNSETSRYVYRILSYKLIFENPRIYGLDICPAQLYQPIPCKEITVTTSIADLAQFAAENNVTYKELRMLNPWICNSRLTVPAGVTYTIQIPVKAGEDFQLLYDHINNPFLVIGDSVYRGSGL